LVDPARDFADAALEVRVTRGHDVALVLPHAPPPGPEAGDNRAASTVLAASKDGM